jgi:hypothetical protein
MTPKVPVDQGSGRAPPPKPELLAAQRAARLHRDGWRAVCRALRIPDPEPDGPPIGLCGNPPKFLKRFEIGTWGNYGPVPMMVDGVRVSSTLPAPISNRKRQKNGRIVITVPEPPEQRNFIKDHRPIMRRYSIELQPSQLPEWTWRPPAWMLLVPRIPATIYRARPASAYIPHRRIAAGGQTSKHIADPNDNEHQQNCAAEPGALPTPVVPLRVGFELLWSTAEIAPVIWDADLRRDMETRYEWQPPRQGRRPSARQEEVLARRRLEAWIRWFPPKDHAEAKRAKAAERQRRHRARRRVVSTKSPSPSSTIARRSR